MSPVILPREVHEGSFNIPKVSIFSFQTLFSGEKLPIRGEVHPSCTLADGNHVSPALLASEASLVDGSPRPNSSKVVRCAVARELLEIRWPSGLNERLENVSANQILTVREGAQPPKP